MDIVITKLDTHMFTDGKSNVVTKIHWEASEDGVTVVGATRPPKGSATFRAFEDLSDAVVRGWLMARLDLGRVRKQMQDIREAGEKTQLAPPWSGAFEYVELEHIKAKRQRYEYKEALERLSRYVLSEGRPEVREMLPTGEQAFDEESGEMKDVLAEVVTVTAIDPLEPTVEQTVYDEEGNASIEIVPNPLIVKDEEERAAAQAVIDATPAEIKESVQ